MGKKKTGRNPQRSNAAKARRVERNEKSQAAKDAGAKAVKEAFGKLGERLAEARKVAQAQGTAAQGVLSMPDTQNQYAGTLEWDWTIGGPHEMDQVVVRAIFKTERKEFYVLLLDCNGHNGMTPEDTKTLATALLSAAWWEHEWQKHSGAYLANGGNKPIPDDPTGISDEIEKADDADFDFDMDRFKSRQPTETLAMPEDREGWPAPNFRIGTPDAVEHDCIQHHMPSGAVGEFWRCPTCGQGWKADEMGPLDIRWMQWTGLFPDEGPHVCDLPNANDVADGTAAEDYRNWKCGVCSQLWSISRLGTWHRTRAIGDNPQA